jgi:membrane protein YqaA with SNARE-associated domain
MLHNWLQQPGYISLFTVSFLASTLLPLGSEWLLVMMLAGGYPALPTVVVATAGNCLGAVTTYLIGMYGGGWFVERVLRVSLEQQKRAHTHYKRFGVYSLLLSWVPVIGDPLCLVAGILRINFIQFATLVATGKLVRYVVTAWVALRAVTGS